VGVTTGAVFLIELSDWEWENLAEGAVVGLAAMIAFLSPSWLRTGSARTQSKFAAEYAEVDREVWRELMDAEKDWQAGQIDDAEYSRVFDRSNVRYQALRPPPGEWDEIVQERIRIREGWSKVFRDPSNSSQTERDALGIAEAALRKRIARAS
jgi:hypothetical protein